MRYCSSSPGFLDRGADQCTVLVPSLSLKATAQTPVTSESSGFLSFAFYFNTGLNFLTFTCIWSSKFLGPEPGGIEQIGLDPLVEQFAYLLSPLFYKHMSLAELLFR